MDANQWAQKLGEVKAMAEIGSCSSSRVVSSSERKARPQKDQVVNCPRCQSTNTKFCYYNNYSLTQPRYFCKTCRRYWTAGGTLRNVPVGGGSRKNRRSNTSTSSSVSTQKILDTKNISQYSSPNPNNNNKIHEGHDLNLSFPYGQQEYHFAPQIQLFEFPRYESCNNNIGTAVPHHHELKPSSSSASTPFAALELLRNGFSSSNSHMETAGVGQSSNGVYNMGFPFQELKPSGLSFSVSNRYGSNGIQMHDQDNNEKVMFPLESSMKQNTGGLGDGSNHDLQEQNKGQQISNGCWNEMLGGGSWQ